MTLIEKNQLEEVRIWLNGKRNYHRGMMLLMAYSPNKPLVASLKQWDNPALLERYLLEMYHELVEKESHVTSHEPQMAVTPPLERGSGDLKIEKPTPKKADLRKLDEIDRLRKKHYRDRGMWHAQMCDIGCDEDGHEKPKMTAREMERRCELAKLIIEATDKISELWTITDHFEKYGTMPAEKETEVTAPTTMTKDEAFKRLKNSVAPNISKLKGKIAKSTDQKMIDKWTVQLTALESEKRELETLTNAA